MGLRTDVKIMRLIPSCGVLVMIRYRCCGVLVSSNKRENIGHCIFDLVETYMTKTWVILSPTY